MEDDEMLEEDPGAELRRQCMAYAQSITTVKSETFWKGEGSKRLRAPAAAREGRQERSDAGVQAFGGGTLMSNISDVQQKIRQRGYSPVRTMADGQERHRSPENAPRDSSVSPERGDAEMETQSEERSSNTN
ncbi:hypothetical protein GUITHDRAFT_154938 [Guillardia theta CCMP2712]|uniref:Uncharacterized protein n=3 Tax=Guillardia theta TaxID=55529 RepID=L1IP15_GUITC|nr:hypothetical protein GUITHDRAFT_154938 [Guillardia theta CCMP2712]EKX37634.1 hypothetical protein GUITHDRAFT_154938 [Guillardia theta CCMP2712]|mmetsp:Transcript_39806/g.125051  ORF Transcript_39806/g.125051 Transcript_39806/m.125051 type:complete len:132 (+) Transcript_39806:1075-1470(+)|eukprot:XP_005824614.1 hypothetical protein GUITHDRAFT_154938 [Guillardia theta CCMP2712]